MSAGREDTEAATSRRTAARGLPEKTPLRGRSTIDGLTRHLGLNKQAADDMSQLFTSTSATSGAITGTAWVFFSIGGAAAGSAIQELYERAFDLDRRGLSDFPRRLVWLAVLIGCAVAAGEVGATLRHAGGPVLLGVIGLLGFTAFFWFTMWLLLSGRMPARQLFPAALATGVCWVGMEAVFSVMFSGMVVFDDSKYGAIGVVFAFMLWFIAIGVVIILGVVVGVVWRERTCPFGLRSIMRRGDPMHRAVLSLSVLLPLFVLMFACIYLTISRSNPAAFGAPLDS